MPAASFTLNCAQPAVAPISVAIRFTNSAALPSRRSAAFRRTERRALGPSLDQAGKDAAAASAAACASATLAAAARLATSPVIGSRRSKVAPVEAATSRSSMRRLMSIMSAAPRSAQWEECRCNRLGIGFAIVRCSAEIGAAHGRVVAKIRRAAFADDPPCLDEIAPVRDGKALARVLLDQQDADTALPNSRECAEQLLAH